MDGKKRWVSLDHKGTWLVVKQHSTVFLVLCSKEYFFLFFFFLKVWMFQDEEFGKLPSAFCLSSIQFNSNHSKSYFVSNRLSMWICHLWSLAGFASSVCFKLFKLSISTHNWNVSFSDTALLFPFQALLFSVT